MDLFFMFIGLFQIITWLKQSSSYFTIIWDSLYSLWNYYSGMTVRTGRMSWIVILVIFVLTDNSSKIFFILILYNKYRDKFKEYKVSSIKFVKMYFWRTWVGNLILSNHNRRRLISISTVDTFNLRINALSHHFRYFSPD